MLRLCWDPAGIGDRRRPGRPRRDIRSRKSVAATDELLAADHRSGRLDPTARQLPTALPMHNTQSNAKQAKSIFIVYYTKITQIMCLENQYRLSNFFSLIRQNMGGAGGGF